ncbi:uncharacterized protein CIMG_08385 [Coccidioides immitis RS]|uniref:Uncharacterized protein n=1 Tax=Coccidioides immitis (strain RS) TaxID=246410 RepID=J3K5E1_COCIM|nr:uncharacterized protein CIMG_08385 [Coccidioides immitis RS]EAS29639.3 hypothetical protein CIMG_08385 [Coccidioides immitis RS]
MSDDSRYFFSANSFKKAHEASQNICTINLRVDSGHLQLHCNVVAWVQSSAAKCQVFIIYEYQGIKTALLKPSQQHSFNRYHLPQMRYHDRLMPEREIWLANQVLLNGIQLVAKDINEERYCIKIKYLNSQQRFLKTLETDETVNKNLESLFNSFCSQNHVDTVSSQQHLKFKPFYLQRLAVTQHPDRKASKFLNRKQSSSQQAIMARPKSSQKKDSKLHEQFHPAIVETPSHSRSEWSFMNFFSAKKEQ